MHPYNMGGGYVNFMFDDEADGRVQAAYGDNYAAVGGGEDEVRPGQPVQGQSEYRAGLCVSEHRVAREERLTQTVVYATLALLAFAANSVLCRLALREATIDPATFSSVRVVSGAAMLLLVMSWTRGNMVVARSGRGHRPRCSSCTRCRFPSPTRGECRDRRADPVRRRAGHDAVIGGKVGRNAPAHAMAGRPYRAGGLDVPGVSRPDGTTSFGGRADGNRRRLLGIYTLRGRAWRTRSPKRRSTLCGRFRW